MGIVRRRARRRGLVAGAAIGASMAHRNNDQSDQETPEAPETVAPETVDPAEEIKKLSDLKDQGILTQEEFDQKKKELLEL